MKRHRRRIRIWLLMGATTASFVFASSAAAMRSAYDDAGPVVKPQAHVSTAAQGFDWKGPAILLAAAVLLAIVAYAVPHLARNRGRIAPSH